MNLAVSYDWDRPQNHEPLKTFLECTQQLKIFDRISDGLFAVLLFGLLGVTVAYYKYRSDSAFNRFFNGNTLGLHFFIICSSSTKENLVFVDIDYFLAIYSEKFAP